MENFLNKLYNYEYFGTYLMIAIAVLVLLFIIVLFFGKKDQKKREIEETKKLQQVNNTNAFKEESNVANVAIPKEEITNPISQEKLENDTIIVPNINNLATDTNNEVIKDEIPEPVLPTNEVNDDTLHNNNLNIEPVKEESEPVLNKIEEKPLVFENVQNEEITFALPEENIIEPVTPLVDVPEFNYDEIANGVEELKHENESKPSEIFSSVYVPQKEQVELPKLEENKSKQADFDIELPTLKKESDEENIEMPELHDYNLDNISGEDYNINR